MTQITLFTRPAPPPYHTRNYVPWNGSEMDAFRALPEIEVRSLFYPARPDGAPHCQIRIKQSDVGYHWSTSWMLSNAGSGGPIDYARYADTRDDALAHAVAEIEEALGNFDRPDAIAAVEWARSLQ
jgi:hypothetical protein